MKHLRKFENNVYGNEWIEDNILSMKEQEIWEPSVRHIYKIFMSSNNQRSHGLHFHKEYIDMINDIQDEFDHNDTSLPSTYIIHKSERKLAKPDDPEFDEKIACFEAYGPKHALARYVMDGYNRLSEVLYEQVYAHFSRKEDTKKEIEKHQNVVNMLQNPKELKL